MATNNAINVGVVAGGGQTYTFPAATDTLVGRASTDTLTNKTIALGSNTVSGTKAQFNTAVSDGDIVFLDSTDTITGVKTMTGLNSILVSSSGLTVRNPANTFKYTITGAALAADRILNLPLITATDTLASLGLAQTWTATQTFTTPVLGTPTSGTLTNCTGLPIAGLVASTSTALGVGSIELGHASDTTISRGAAGFIAVEGNRVPSPASQASGDILYRGSTEWERLPKGTASQVLTMNAGATAPEWQTPSGGAGVGTTFSLGKSAGVAGASGISFGDTIFGDTYSFAFADESESGILITTSGTLRNFFVGFGANTLDASVVFTVRKNGSDTSLTVTRTSGSSATVSDTSNTVSVAAGDVITIKGVVSGSSGSASPYYSLQLN